MMTVKAGIAFPLQLDTTPDRVTIAPEDIIVKYSLANSSNTPTVSTGTTVTKENGNYVHMLTINQTGYYTVNVFLPGDGVTSDDENISVTALVTNATVDDVYTLVGTVDGKIDAIKSQVDLLDEATLNGLNTEITNVQTKLQDIVALISDENDAGITSLKELLQQLSTSVAGSNSSLTAIDGYIRAATDDIENMIAGTEFLADGSANPFYGNTNVDIMDALNALGVTLQQSVDDAKTAVLSKVDDAKLELAGDIAAVQAVVDANADLLESDVFGLAKLMTTLEAFKSAESNHFTTVVDALDSISQALSTTNGGLASKLDSIESKIDVVTTIVKKTATAKIV